MMKVILRVKSGDIEFDAIKKRKLNLNIEKQI